MNLVQKLKAEKKALNLLIAVAQKEQVKIEEQQKRQFAKIEKAIYNFAKEQFENAKIDTENVINFKGCIDLQGTKFKEISCKKVTRTSKLEKKKAVKMQGKSKVPQKTPQIKLGTKKHFA